MEGSAPGPAATPPPDPNTPRSGQADPRAVDLEGKRAAEGGVRSGTAATSIDPALARQRFREFDDPAGAVLVTEVQELNRKVDMIGTAALAGIWLVGMLVGVAVFHVGRVKREVETVMVEDTEVEGE